MVGRRVLPTVRNEPCDPTEMMRFGTTAGEDNCPSGKIWVDVADVGHVSAWFRAMLVDVLVNVTGHEEEKVHESDRKGP